MYETLLVQLEPYIASLVITVVFALIGYQASGEKFDMDKFAATLGASVAGMIAVIFVGNPVVTLLTPSLIAIFVMKLYSWYKTYKASKVVVVAPVA